VVGHKHGRFVLLVKLFQNIQALNFWVRPR
jgi:hypothetical protein